MERLQAEKPDKHIIGVRVVLHLDCSFPLPAENLFPVHSFLTYTIIIQNKAINNRDLGTLSIGGNPEVRPETPGGAVNNKSVVTMVFTLSEPTIKSDVLTVFGDQEMMALGVVGRSIKELNRIIDLYRIGGFPQYLHHRLSIWNVETYQIEFIDTSKESHSFADGSGKAFQFNGDPYRFLYDKGIIGQILSGDPLPFYYLLYLNGRKSFAEDNFREAQINCANCCEALTFYLIDELIKHGFIKKTATFSQDAKARFSHINHIMVKNNLPTMKGLGKVFDRVWKYRNQVMHGQGADELTRTEITDVFDSITKLIDWGYEIVETITKQANSTP